MAKQPARLELEKDDFEKFRTIVKEHKDQEWSIIVAAVDPDGLGTAMILKEILQDLGSPAVIYYGGAFSHRQNKLLWNLFKFEEHLKPIDALPETGPVALADSCKLEDSRFPFEITSDRFRIVVDHHRDAPLVENGRFVYIASVGAAVTLAHRLAKTIGVTLSEAACTMGALGILSDTDRLIAPNVKPEDLQALAELMQNGSQKQVWESFDFELPSRFFEIQSQCLRSATVIGSFLISRPRGLITDEEGDFLGTIADQLKQREGIKTVIIWGATQAHIRGSVRTKSRELELNDLIEDIAGRGSGGGKDFSGGFKIPLPDTFRPTRESVPHLIAFFDASFREKLEGRAGSKANAASPDENGTSAQ